MPETGNKVVGFKLVHRSKGGFVRVHKADKLYFGCCDFRFRKETSTYMDGQPGTLVDQFIFPGGVMLFVGAKYGHPDMREGAVHWTKLLADAHHVDGIEVEVHGKHSGKCGAYALSPKLAGKSDEELHELQLQDAVEVKELLESVTGKPVTLIYKEAAEDGSDDILFYELELGKEEALAEAA